MGSPVSLSKMRILMRDSDSSDLHWVRTPNTSTAWVGWSRNKPQGVARSMDVSHLDLEQKGNISTQVCILNALTSVCSLNSRCTDGLKKSQVENWISSWRPGWLCLGYLAEGNTFSGGIHLWPSHQGILTESVLGKNELILGGEKKMTKPHVEKKH